MFQILTVVRVFLRFVDSHVRDDDFVAGTPHVAGVQLQLQRVQPAQVFQQKERLISVGFVVSELARLCVIDLKIRKRDGFQNN